MLDENPAKVAEHAADVACYAMKYFERFGDYDDKINENMEDFILRHKDFFVAVMNVNNFNFQNRDDLSRKRSASAAWLEGIPQSHFFYLSGDNLRHRYCVVASRTDSTSLAEFARAAQDFAQKLWFELLNAGEHQEVSEAHTVQQFMNDNGN